MISRTCTGIAAAVLLTTLPAVAEDLEANIGRPGGVVSTTPIIRSESTVGAPAPRIDKLVAGQASEPASPTPNDGAQSAYSPEALGFVLGSEQLPWPLRYRQLSPPTVLYLPLPEVPSLRLMLPGHTLEEARQARAGVARYITNLIGVAAQDRARQLDAFNAWADQTLKQKATLNTDDEWLQYVFWGQAHASVESYRVHIVPQSEAVTREMSGPIQAFAANVTDLMNAAQGYEQRMAWYQVLTQLKEGLQLYQIQMQEGDAQVLQAVNYFVGTNPPVARPESPLPTMDASTGKRAMPKVEMPRTPEIAPVRRPAEAPTATVVAEEGNSLVAYLVIAGVLAPIGLYFLRLRKRKKPQAPAA